RQPPAPTHPDQAYAHTDHPAHTPSPTHTPPTGSTPHNPRNQTPADPSHPAGNSHTPHHTPPPDAAQPHAHPPTSNSPSHSSCYGWRRGNRRRRRWSPRGPFRTGRGRRSARPAGRRESATGPAPP